MKKMTQVTKSSQKSFGGLPKVKTTSIHTPNRGSTLPAKKHNQKGWVCNPNRLVKWGKMTQYEQFISETFHGIHMGKNGRFNPPIRGSTLPLTVQHPKMKFPNRVKDGTTKKMPRIDPSH